MAHWLDRSENRAGEWCVTDLRRGYRICNYNHTAHGGPHLHAPGIEVRRIALRSASEAERVMRRYAQRHREFDARALQKEVETWRSGSKSA